MKGEEIYRIKADGSGKSPYNLAMADWFHAPQIIAVDLSGWNGDIGQVIRIRAQDDVKATEVRIQISNGTGALLEAGQAVEAGALWWEYTSMQHFTGDLTVTVSAKDLPGHSTQVSEQKTVTM